MPPAQPPDASPPQLPFSLAYPAYLNTRQRRAIYEAQIRGFVEAAEAVELDEDVLSDLLDGFDDYDVEDAPVRVDDDDGPPPEPDAFGYPGDAVSPARFSARARASMLMLVSD
jgi:hypothetical protein